MDALDKDIRDNGCHQCGEELIERRKVHDEGLEKDFCDVECQLTFYQEEYNRLITKSNKLDRDRVIAELELEATRLELKEARAEIRTVWDSARVAMVQTGQGIVS